MTPLRAISTLAVPAIISQLINLVYNVADTMFLGMTGDAYKIAGVSLAFPLFMFMIPLSALFGFGGGGLMSRLYGAGDKANAKRVTAFSFYCSLMVAAAYSAIILVFMDPLLSMLGASENTLPYVRTYILLVVVSGNIPAILANTLATFLRNAGYSNIASIGQSGGGILNIILDPLFMFVIFPKGSEVTGAAAATLLSNIAAFLFLFIFIMKISKKAPVSVNPKEALHSRTKDRKEVFKMGIPAALLPGLFDVASILWNALLASYGDLQLAAFGIITKIDRLPNAINIGISQAVMPLVAYNYASGNSTRLKDIVKTSRVLGLVISIVCIALLNVFAAPLSALFMNTSGENAAAAAATLVLAEYYLHLRSLASAPQFLNYHTSFCIQAIGDAKSTLIHGILRIAVFHMPLLFILNAVFNDAGVCISLFISEALGAAVALILWKRDMNSMQTVR